MNHKVGYIGFGEMASGYHYQVAATRDDVKGLEPYAVFDLREERRKEAQSRGLKTFDNLDDFLKSDVDIVVVALPNNLHHDNVIAALRAGKNVICEKPVAMNCREYEEMCAVAEETGMKFCVHQNRRFDRDFMYVKQIIESGKIGKVFHIESRVEGEIGGDLWDWRGFRDQGGGHIRDWGVHLLDQIIYLANEPLKSYYGVIKDIGNDECDDFSKVMLNFESGLTAEVEVSTFVKTQKLVVLGDENMQLPRWVVYGDRGVIIVGKTYAEGIHVLEYTLDKDGKKDALSYTMKDVLNRKLTQSGLVSIRRYSYPENEEDKINQDWAELYKNIIAYIDGKEDYIVKPCQVHDVLEILDTATESLQKGESVFYKKK